ncbi:ankyrin repeat domain-containing protein [Ensifer adhaerens]|uniref:ankyrin repeat domain-containing protein n=1 Tax=Ensifer adhaerens TaxID=106592 RepID=UPI0034DF5CFE
MDRALSKQPARRPQSRVGTRHPLACLSQMRKPPRFPGANLSIRGSILPFIVWVLLVLSFLSGPARAGGDFFEVIRSGTADDVRSALRAGADVNASDRYGRTPLMFAVAVQGDASVVKDLIDAGGRIDVQDPLFGNTLLLSALERSDVSPALIQILLEAGVDLGARTLPAGRRSCQLPQIKKIRWSFEC